MYVIQSSGIPQKEEGHASDWADDDGGGGVCVWHCGK